MIPRLPLSGCGAIFAATLPLAAQTTILPEDNYLETAFYAENMVFLTDENNDGGFDSETTLGGMDIRQIKGTTRVYSFCSEFFVGSIANPTYYVSDGFGPIGTIEQNAIRALFSNSLPVFKSLYEDYLDHVPSGAEDPAFQSEFDNLQGYAAGMQVALWEILEENILSYSIDDGGLPPASTAGIFKTDFDANAGASPGLENQNNLGVLYAETFLQNIQGDSPVWTDTGGFRYYYADGMTEQSRLWIEAIPEPSTALLGLLGMSLLLRRRRD